MKNKNRAGLSFFLKMLLGLLTGLGAFMGVGYGFFSQFIYVDRKKKMKPPFFFKLKETSSNHPADRYHYAFSEGKKWCEEQTTEDFQIVSQDGLSLHASYLRTESPERILILCHGFKGAGFGDFAFISRFLHENHCNLLYIDERSCGKSEGNYITFGAKESQDIRDWADFIVKQDGGNLPVYLYGMSLGASSVVMAGGLELPDQVKGIIDDCGYYSMESAIRGVAENWFHIKHIRPLLFIMNFYCRIFAGFSMDEACTKKALGKNTRPMLFFHGSTDTFVNPADTRWNYSLCRAPKELVIIKGAKHLCSCYADSQLYERKLMEFFGKYDKALQKYGF